MTDPLDQIALLRRLADRGRAGELGADGVQLAAGLDCYFERARLGVTLEEALGVKPAPGGDPFWQVEDRWHRDCLLWEYAKKFLPGGSAAAGELGDELRRYNRGAWARDRRQPEMPAAYAGRPRELLFRAFRATELFAGSMPMSRKRLAVILASVCAETGKPSQKLPPIGVQEDAQNRQPNSGSPHDAVSSNDPKASQRRRDRRRREGSEEGDRRTRKRA